MPENTFQASDAAYNAFAENMRIMNQIVREMKEIPELPSEVIKETNPLIRVEFPQNGGVLTYMEGYELPYKGFPYFEFVDRIDWMKKTTRAFLSALYHSFKGKRKFLLIALLPAVWFLKYFVHAGIYVFYRMVERFRIKALRYSDCIRELHRAFSLPRDKEKIKTVELRYMLRDLVCMILEFDNAYRYRMQDILPEINQQEIKKNTIKELKRLFTIMQERERTQEIRDTWKLVKLGLIYLKFDRELKNILADALSQVNLEKIKLSFEDIQFCKARKDYKFNL